LALTNVGVLVPTDTLTPKLAVPVNAGLAVGCTESVVRAAAASADEIKERPNDVQVISSTLPAPAEERPSNLSVAVT
jgi:hypothetical protein